MRGKPFQPGNKFGKGRPPGSRNKRTLMSDAIQEHGEAIVKQCVVMALKGNPVAMRICMDRLARDSESSKQKFRLPPGKSIQDLPLAMQQLILGIAEKKISSQDAITIANMLEKSRSLETRQSASLDKIDAHLSRLSDDDLDKIAELYRELTESERP
jgi:hypothetical protein